MREPDFSGYVTKAGVECADGRTIMPEAFKHMNGKRVPMVWNHGHGTPENVLGYVDLEHRNDGVYGRGFFNQTPKGLHSKALVEHGDVNMMSIYANKVVERSKQVLHGFIREVSLVLSGANPKATIDYVRIQHSNDEDDFTDSTEDAVICMSIEFEHGNGPKATETAEEVEETVEHAASNDMTVQQVYDQMDDVEKDVVNFMIAAALEKNGDVAQSENKGEGDLEHTEGTNEDMTRTSNVFEGETDANKAGNERNVLSHSDQQAILNDWKAGKGSLKAIVENYAIQHGITNIDVLFPDARNLTNTPQFKTREMEWVGKVLNGTSHTPFSRVKTVWADITAEEARAKGYVTGAYKKEEWFRVTKRTTTPATIYKKQKLDRDDILDITDFDVVAWMKAEMQVMIKEELARAVLLGDGRAVDDEDKIADPIGATDGAGIRSIYHEHEAFAVTVNVNLADANSSYKEAIIALKRSRRHYKGSGRPTFFTTEQHLTEFLLLEDTTGRPYYDTVESLARVLNVAEIVTVEPMDEYADLLGIIVNLSDYNIGADKGGELTMFDDFDIDYNQYKYLIETRLSGALTKLFSAIVIKTVASGAALVNPITAPTFVKATGVVTIPTQTGVTYKNADTSATLSAGAQSALAAGATLNVKAVPASASYYFLTDQDDEWSFTRPAA